MESQSFVLQDILLSFVISILLVILKNYFINPLLRHIKIPDIKKTKLKNCLHKIAFYGFTSFYGYYVLTTDTTFVNFYSFYTVHNNLRLNVLTRIYYALEFSYYLTELQNFLTDYTAKDRYQLIVHHIITLTLILLSYFNARTNVGMIVMALHDVSDPILESAKVFIYLKHQKLANLTFVVFTFIFEISRLFIFPCIVIFPEIKHLLREKFCLVSTICVLLLICLYILHLYWSVMIYRTFKKIFLEKKLQDARSSSSMENE